MMKDILIAVFSLMLWPALVSSQSLVLVGGALADGNAPVWNKVVELAVTHFLMILNCVNSAIQTFIMFRLQFVFIGR